MIEYENPLARRGLVEQVLRLMGIAESDGLGIWLDGSLGRDAIAGTRNHALFLPPEIGTPPELLKVRRRFQRVPAIWVSKDDVEGPDLSLTIVVAHELRHFEQHHFDPNLWFSGGVAREYIQWAGGIRPLDNPVEWDAEVQARDVAVQQYGEDAVSACYAATGYRELISPVPVPTLPETAARLRQWLRNHLEGVRRMLLNNEGVVHGPRETFELVDWERFRMHDFVGLGSRSRKNT